MNNPEMEDEVRSYIESIPSKHRSLFNRLHGLILDEHPTASVVLSCKIGTPFVWRPWRRGSY